MKKNIANSSRRTILKAITAGCALPFLPACNLFNEQQKQIWLSAAGSTTDNYALAWSSPNNHSKHHITGFRGHGLAQHINKPNQAVMVSRRPGNQGVVFDSLRQSEIHTFNSPKHLFMEGHACFDQAGKTLFCTESNKQTQLGVITVRETSTYTLNKEFYSGGVGPHELLNHPTIPDTLIIANGGLIKNEAGKITNGSTMASNISFLNIVTGEVTQQFRVKENKASLRHIDVSHDGIIAVAMQVQRPFCNHQRLTSLTALIKDKKLIELSTPIELLSKMQDYVGSVRINNKYRTAAFTSPRGNLALFWNIDTGDFIGQHYFHNVCGLSVSADEEYFVMSNSVGKIRQVHSKTLIEQRDLRQYHPEHQWDNHLLTQSPT